MFPPIPTWENVHPLVVHFPIALLLFAPLFVVVALVFPARGRWASWAAALLLIGGTATAFLSVATGEAARDLVKHGADEMLGTLARHAQLAEISRTVFAVLTVAYVVLLALPLLWKKLSGAYFHVVTHLIFLLALLGAGLLLANVGYLGGRLVHEFGVHANLGSAPAPAPADSGKPDDSEAVPPKGPEEKPVGPEAESPMPPDEEPDESDTETPKPELEKPDESEAESPNAPEEKPDGADSEAPKAPEEKPDGTESEAPKASDREPDRLETEPPKDREEKANDS